LWRAGKLQIFVSAQQFVLTTSNQTFFAFVKEQKGRHAPFSLPLGNIGGKPSWQQCSIYDAVKMVCPSLRKEFSKFVRV
jgi:hypothetical protein